MYTDLSLRDIEFIKVLAESGNDGDSGDNNDDNNDDNSTRLAVFLNNYDSDIKKQGLFFDRICAVLRGHHQENTMGVLTGLSEKFSDAGITQDDAKAAISYARRLGAQI